MISIECNSCKRKLRVPADAGGKTVKCPCGEGLLVPSSALRQTAAASVSHQTSAAQEPVQHFTHRCNCGRTLRVAKGESDKLAKCPCGTTFSVPRKETAFAEQEIFQAIPVARPAVPVDEPVHAPALPYRGEILSNVASGPIRSDPKYSDLPSSRSLAGGYLENARRESLSGDTSQGGGIGNFLDSTVIGGFIVMLVAVVWFVAGLAGGLIFYYPPVMFVLGFITVIKGLLSND